MLGRFGEDDADDAPDDDASDGSYSKVPDDQAVAVVFVVSHERFDSVDVLSTAAAAGAADVETGSRFFFRQLAGLISLIRSTTTGGGEDGGEAEEDAAGAGSSSLVLLDALPPKDSRPRFFRTDHRPAAFFVVFLAVGLLLVGTGLSVSRAGRADRTTIASRLPCLGDKVSDSRTAGSKEHKIGTSYACFAVPDAERCDSMFSARSEWVSKR